MRPENVHRLAVADPRWGGQIHRHRGDFVLHNEHIRNASILRIEHLPAPQQHPRHYVSSSAHSGAGRD